VIESTASAKGTPPDAPALGIAVVVAIAVAQIAFLAIVSGSTDQSLSDGAAQNGAILWWQTINGWMWPEIAACFVAYLVIPGAFGLRWRQLVPSLPRGRWGLVAAVAATIVVCDIGAVIYGREGGYASVAGATWTRNNAPVAHHAWSEVINVQVGCEMGGRRSGVPYLVYSASFADGRQAPLSWTSGYSRLSKSNNLQTWVAAVEPIDAKLRDYDRGTRHIMASAGDAPECLQHYAAMVDAGWVPRLYALLSASQPNN
jgi:hypothetical protein